MRGKLAKLSFSACRRLFTASTFENTKKEREAGAAAQWEAREASQRIGPTSYPVKYSFLRWHQVLAILSVGHNDRIKMR